MLKFAALCFLATGTASAWQTSPFSSIAKRSCNVSQSRQTSALDMGKKISVVCNDSISDMLTRIRNAQMVKHQVVRIPATKMNISIAQILKDEGFIEDFESFEEQNIKFILATLKYAEDKKPVITKIYKVSKPGLKVYSNAKELPKVLDNLGIAIISTSQGVMTNFKARDLNIGGEVLCELW